MIPGTGGEEGEPSLPLLATTVMVPTHFIPSLKKWFEAEFSVDMETSREGEMDNARQFQDDNKLNTITNFMLTIPQ